MERVLAALSRYFAHLGGRLRAVRTRTLLAIGWLGLFLYAQPGYMSFDSVTQLTEARAGRYSDAYPPALAWLWGCVDFIVPGPIGMLMIQTTCCLAGAYLIFRRVMPPRAAAVCAALLLWFPPVASILGGIWKDAQLAGYVLLGVGLLLQDRRRWKLVGLGLVLVGTLMRRDAFMITLPLVGALFVWNARHAWWQRYAIAIAAWLAITASAIAIDAWLTDDPKHVWHRTTALTDIVGTLSHAEPIPDSELAPILAGTPVVPTAELHAQARAAYAPEWTLDALGGKFFAEPTTAEQRAAITRAWRAIVQGHLGAYLAYRAELYGILTQLTAKPVGSSIYVWFSDVGDMVGSADRVQHNSYPTRLQDKLQRAMLWLGDTWLFKPYIYLAVALALLVLCRRDRLALALLASGFTSQLAMFVLGFLIDFRDVYWLVIATVMATMLALARRAGLREPVLEERRV